MYRVSPESCLCWSDQLLQQGQKKLSTQSVWCDQQKALSHAGIQPQSLRSSQLSLGRLRGSSITVLLKPCLQALCEHGLPTWGSNPCTDTCIQVQTLTLYFSALLIFVSMCTAYLFSVFHFSQFCFALLIYINRLSFAPLN